MLSYRVLASIDQSLLTRLGSLLLWCALADILWRAATNQFSSSKKENIVSSRLHIPSRPKKIMSFENAVILKSTPLKLVDIILYIRGGGGGGGGWNDHLLWLNL